MEPSGVCLGKISAYTGDDTGTPATVPRISTLSRPRMLPSEGLPDGHRGPSRGGRGSAHDTVADSRAVALSMSHTHRSTLPDCFASTTAHTSAAYLKGHWLQVDTNSSSIYNFARLLQKSVYLEPSSNYGMCYDADLLRRSARQVNIAEPVALPSRPALSWAWQPSQCELAVLDPVAGCSSLHSRTILFVGDSVLQQLFFSFAIQLNATFLGRPYGRRTENLINATVKSCSRGPIHLHFRRNDLLSETRPAAHPDCLVHISSQRVCDPIRSRARAQQLRAWAQQVAADPGAGSSNQKKKKTHMGRKWTQSSHQLFLESAASADAVVLGTGHHFHDAAGRPFWHHKPHDGRTYFERTLSETLAQINAMRAQHGHHNSSTLLISPVASLPGCTDFNRPIELPEALERLDADASVAANKSSSGAVRPRSIYSLQWARWRRLLPKARGIANATGASFLDLSTVSATRPDMHLAAWRRWDYRRALPANELDCVHYCLPGPPDSFAMLAFNVLKSVLSVDGG